MTVQGIMQQEQSSPHQQGSFTPGVMRLRGEVVEEDVADEEDEEDEVLVERPVEATVVMTCLGILSLLKKVCRCVRGMCG
jgi:hypothetical protein